MSSSLSIKILLALLVAVILFHIAVIVSLVPLSIVWGGRLKNNQEMYVFETISILVNLVLIIVLLMKAGYIKQRLGPKFISGILWFFFGVFVLNTVGNLFAVTALEKLFAVVTLFFAMLIWIIVRAKPAN